MPRVKWIVCVLYPRLKHKLRRYDLPFIAAKIVLVLRLRLLSAPCDDGEDRGELAAKAIRDLKTGGKLSYHRPLAVQEFPTIRSGSYLQLVTWQQRGNGAMRRIAGAPVSSEAQKHVSQAEPPVEAG